MKVFLILVVCLVVRNNLCDNSSSLMFISFIINIVSVFISAADLNLFHCEFLSLTLVS